MIKKNVSHSLMQGELAIISRSCHPTYPLGARAELKGDAVVGLREIYIALAGLYSVGSPLLYRDLLFGSSTALMT